MKEIARRLEVKRISKLRNKRRKFKAVVVVTSCLCSLALLIILARLDKLIVKNVSVTGTSLVSAEKIKDLVMEKLSGNYPLWVPKQSTLFFPKDDITAAVLTSFLPVEDVVIKRDGLEGLSVEVKERPTNFVWCGTEPNSNNDCYFVDNNGLIFEKATVFDQSQSILVFSPVIRNYNRSEDQLMGGRILTIEEFVSLVQLIDAVKRAGIGLSQVVVDNGEIDLYTQKGWPIYAPLGERLTRSAAVFSAAVSARSFGDPSKFDTLEYFDLRYGNKVYFKHKNSATLDE